jgi:hypothetical protein
LASKVDKIIFLKIIFVAAMFFPLFFQLPFNLYVDSSTLIKSSAGITKLPIPFSVPICFLGIALFGGFKSENLPYWILICFIGFLMIFASSIVSIGNISIEKWKLLLFQYSFPMFGYILGYSITTLKFIRSILGIGILIPVSLIIPLQLYSTWVDRISILSHPGEYKNFIIYLQLCAVPLGEKVLFFTIYQHSQYVAFILVSAFFFTLYSLGNYGKIKYIFLILTPFVGIYSIASASKLTLICFLLGIISYSIYNCRRNYWYFSNVLVVISLIFTIGYYLLAKEYGGGHGLISRKLAVLQLNETPSINTERGKRSLSDRIIYWRYYANHITENSYSFLWGHPNQPDIHMIPSAHNYYLDYIYNFGFVAFIPILFGISATTWILLLKMKDIYQSPPIIGLTFTFLFVVFIDNLFKVGMRQLYPGFCAFFLWGLLLKCLVPTLCRDK